MPQRERRMTLDAERLGAVRAELARLGLQGFIVPRADEHLSEYVPECAERLAWLTGFTGSAGIAVVLADRAAVFTDGRYVLQARASRPMRRFGNASISPRTRRPPGSPRIPRPAPGSATIPCCSARKHSPATRMRAWRWSRSWRTRSTWSGPIGPPRRGRRRGRIRCGFAGRAPPRNAARSPPRCARRIRMPRS